MIGETANFLLYISIISLFEDPVLDDKYSVIPLNLPVNKVSLETGPLIIPEIFFLLIKSIAISKH